jgi:plasmid stabilization system protein ParE
VDLVFHPSVQVDVRGILGYYEMQGGSALGDRFFSELEAALARIAENPTRFAEIQVGLRRAPLAVFPYHVLFRVTPTHVRVLVLRHDKRHPHVALERR